MKLRIKNGIVYLNSHMLGRIILINNQRVFVSFRKRSVHFFRMFSGFGMSVELLDWLKLQGIEGILIKLQDTNEELHATVTLFQENGQRYEHPRFEPQLVLHEQYFTS